jgi:phosphoserine phosphatase
MTQTLLPATLSAAAFEAAVTQLNPQLAVFDCDGTLWSGDAGSGFMHWSIEQGLLSRDAIDWLDARYRKYLAREVSALAICGEMVQVYQGLREAELRQAAADFFARRIAPGIFPDMQRLIAALQARNVEIWAVSSTNDWVIEEALKRFAIPANRVLAARVEIQDGLATNRLIDVPTDQGKVDALARAGVYIPGTRAPDAVFGNSVHDAAMLAIARRAFPINPSPALVERSARENWPVFFPAAASS